MAIFAIQAALIVALLVQRARRRRAEGEALTLSGRLIGAHEDERRRLGRELHDDVSQRLARLVIDAAVVERSSASAQACESARSLRREIARLSEDVHALSYSLHPSVIEDLGLVEALRAECESLKRQGSIEVSFDADGVPPRLPRETALCLFRVAQEALRNVLRHARATAVAVSLAERPGGVQLTVKDNGTGFSRARQPRGASLGHASMLERVRALGGKLDLQSMDGGGTTVTAWVPLREASS
jgi:signal transduction histidine kinase